LLSRLETRGRPLASSVLARALRLIEVNHGTYRGWARYVLGQLEGIAGARDRFRTIDPHKVGRLVFVCRGNISRSAFAHAVAAGESVDCTSIGLSTSTGTPAPDVARQVAREFGISLDHHAATSITDYQPRTDDLLLLMELRHARPLRSGGIPAERIALLGHWARPIRYHIHDPHTLSPEYYRSCFAILAPAVRNLVHELKQGDSPSVRR
jgi:protein-tyrosine phosphatase